MMWENKCFQNVAPAVWEKIVYSGNILEHIFKFLPTTDLVATRLVCSTWKLECDRVLRSRQLFILLRTEEDVKDINGIMDTLKEQGSTLIFNKFAIIFDRITLEQASVRDFLDSHGLSFEGLRLRFNCFLANTKNTRVSFKHLIENQVCNLKSLEFFGFSEQLWQAKHLFKDSVNLLPKLESIGCFSVEGYRHANECPLYLSLFSRLTSVKKIAINCSNYWNILIEQASSDNQLQKLFSQVQEISMAFPKLSVENKSVTLMRRSIRTEICQPISDSRIFALTPKLFPNVRIFRLCIDDLIPRSDICNLLKNYANQLEQLSMNAYSGGGHEYLWKTYEVDDQPIEQYVEEIGNNEVHHGAADVGLNGDNNLQNNQNHLQDDHPLINELFSTTVFEKLRVLSTGVDIFEPSSTVTHLFHKQLPALTSLQLNCTILGVPRLVWDYNFNSPSLNSLVLTGMTSVTVAMHLLSIGQAFTKVKSLMIMVPNDTVLRIVFKAFPNLEELHICGYFTDDGIMGVHIEDCIDLSIEDLKSLRNLRVRANLSEVSISWLRQLKSIIFLNIERMNDADGLLDCKEL